MATHNSSSRRRILAGVLAPVTLGVAAIVAVAVAQPTVPTTADPALVASTQDCYDMVTISLGGRGDAPRDQSKMLVTPDGTVLPAALSDDYHSHWVDPVVNAPRNTVGDESYAAVYVDYPAHMDSYEEAVNGGVENTKTIIQAIQVSCPDTKFAIVGYSQGADVARRAAQEIGNQKPNDDGSYDIIDPDSVVGVVILADAGRGAGEGPFPGAENEYGNPDGFDQVYQDGKDSASGSGALPDTGGGFGALDGKVASFCSEGDLTCSAPENIALLQLAINVGRQLNIDAMQRDGLTPETGMNVAQVLSGVALAALADISSNDEWMRSDETFLDVLIKVSDPAYVPNDPAVKNVSAGDTEEPIPADRLANLAYLPEKLFKEVVGFIEDNQNTLQVALSDPYQQTLGPDTGHHFDYWRDNGEGKPLTSAEYAAAWLTHLAEQAKNGEPVKTDVDPNTAKLGIAHDEVLAAETTTTTATTSSTEVPATGATEGTISTEGTAPLPEAGVPAPVQGTVPVDGTAPVDPLAVPAPGATAPAEGLDIPAPELTPAPTTTPAPPAGDGSVTSPEQQVSGSTTTTTKAPKPTTTTAPQQPAAA